MNSLCARSWLPWAERVSFMNNNHVIRRQSHLSPMGVYPRSACFVSSRSVATYPTPHVRLTRGRRAKKNFNFLTSQRLVPVETRPRREEIRRRDDRAWARRNMYHQQHMEDVSTRIHYFNAKLRDLIFFPKTRSSTKKPFLGNRSLCATLFARIHYGVTCQLVGGEDRDKLKGILTKALESHPELPRLTEADWRRCTDPTTGNISVGLRYSLSMCRLFVEIGRLIHHGKKNGTPPNLKARHAFIMTHFGDLTKVRSLEQWNEEHDKLKVEDLFTIRQRGITSMSIQTVRRKKELEEYGIPQIYAALGSMSPAEQHALILHAVNHADKLLKFMEQRLYFAAHIELALLSLPEIRSIQAPVRVFFSEFRALHIVRARGAVFPAIHSHAARLAWKAIPVEGQAAYTCFGRRMDRSTMSGQQLFHRYCKRDYGLEQSEISRRYAQLTDMQTAALNFPFYYPITPKRSTSLAFRRFYLKMCAKFGFARSSGPGTGSRPFEAAMRVKWYGMTEDARREYEDKDSLHNAVPMILEGRTLRSTKPVSQDTASSPRQTEKKKIAQDQLLAPSPTLNSSQPNGSSMHERTMWEMPRNLTQHDMSTPRMTGSRESPQVLIV